MKKFRKRYLLLIPVVLVVFAVIFVWAQNRTLSAIIPDVAYIPNGMADDYNNLYSGFTDGHTIWEYELNSVETAEIEEELNNGIWNKVTDETMSETAYYFTFDSKLYLPDGISDDLYYCIYDFGHKKFITVDEDVSLFGWHRATFIYDKENSRYYCSDMAI